MPCVEIPSFSRPVCFRYDTTSGHTPTMFATTSTRHGMERSFVKMALRNAGRDVIHSRIFAPFTRFITNAVFENGSWLPNTEQLFAGGNASVTGDEMWGIPRASCGTPFPNSLKKPLPTHADPHLETQQMYRVQQHPDFWPKS